MEIKDSILELPIGNIAMVNRNIVRGETLWKRKNRIYLQAAKEAGVDVIIDLRPFHFTELIAGMSLKAPFEYQCFPIDDDISDKELLDKLPLLFDRLDNRACYICCRDGLQRTDLALAIYLMFHSAAKVPDLIGHRKNGNLRCDDIMRRINSLYKALTPGTAEVLGLSNFTESEFRCRWELMLDVNRSRYAD